MRNKLRVIQAPMVAMLVALIPTTTGCTEADAPYTMAAPTGDLPSVYARPVFGELKFRRPVFLTHAGDDSDRLFVVEQAGRILVFEDRTDVEESAVFLDIKSKVYKGHNEEGLLSLVFDPDFADTGFFYVYYSASKPRRSVLSRFSVSPDNPNVADPSSEHVILEVEQPWGNHNGSTILFGPDGMMYVSLGDGGAANDPNNYGQDLSTLLATIIRIDVRNSTTESPYSVPEDNPFVDREGARPEIWAYGLRNVWRMSFDPKGRLWAADVGQNRYEEIDVIVKAGNYGWRIREGEHNFVRAEAQDELIGPVVEYPRSAGISVTGGYVCRDESLEGLMGAYVYADYVSGRMWAIKYENGETTAHREILSNQKPPHAASFGEGPNGELYVCAFDRVDGQRGRIYRLVMPN